MLHTSSSRHCSLRIRSHPYCTWIQSSPGCSGTGRARPRIRHWSDCILQGKRPDRIRLPAIRYCRSKCQGRQGRRLVGSPSSRWVGRRARLSSHHYRYMCWDCRSTSHWRSRSSKSPCCSLNRSSHRSNRSRQARCSPRWSSCMWASTQQHSTKTLAIQARSHNRRAGCSCRSEASSQCGKRAWHIRDRSTEVVERRRMCQEHCSSHRH